MCVSTNLASPLANILSFTAYGFDDGCSFSTAKWYMTGISYVINLNGWKNPIESSLVKKLMTGYEKSSISCDMRRPISLPLLHKLIGAIHLAIYIWIGIHLFQSSFTLAFFALLRVSEVTAFTKEDIQILDTSMSVFIKNSKTDQHCSRASVWLPLTSVRVVLFILLKQFSLMSSQINKEVYFAHFNSKHDSVSIF